jgi:pimeloyl-ACP methyl ester carboxylesterase
LRPYNNFEYWKYLVAINEQKIQVGKLEWFYREISPLGSNHLGTVLLLHGLPSQSYCWGEIMEDLAGKGFRAIAPDWIGSGKSCKPHRRDFAYTTTAFISALGEFLAALEISQFSLVVQGFLGSVGLQYALQFPEQVQRLAILNTPLTTIAKLPWSMQQWTIPLVGEMLTQDPLLIDRTLEKGSCYQIDDQYLDVYRRPFLTSSEAGRSLMATAQNLQLAEAMTAISNGFQTWEKPTLVCWGMRDPWLSFDLAASFASSLPKQSMVETTQLPEAGHYPQEHFSGQISEVLLPFLRRQF